MIVSVLQSNLLAALKAVSRSVDRSPTLPVLANVLLEAEDSILKISATNLEFSISANIGAKTEYAGSITVPARTFQELVSRLPDERIDMRVDKDTNTLFVRCGTQDANIRGIDSDEYPPIRHMDEGFDIEISSEVFRDMIKKVAPSAATEEFRPILTGIKFEIEDDKITLVAADGYRLAVHSWENLEDGWDIKGDEPVEFVVPAKAVKDLRGMMNDDAMVRIAFPKKISDKVTDEWTGNSVSFAFSGAHNVFRVVTTCQLLHGRFPDYKSIIPRNFTTTVTADTKDLLMIANRAKIFSRDNAFSTKLRLSPVGEGQLADIIIVGESAERGNTEGRAIGAINGEGMNVSLNVSFLIDLLSVIDEEHVVMQGNGPENPMLFKYEDREDYLYLVMPMSQ